MQNPVPFFIHSLTALSNCMTKAEAFAEAKRLKPEVIPNLRLVAKPEYADVYHFHGLKSLFLRA